MPSQSPKGFHTFFSLLVNTSYLEKNARDSREKPRICVSPHFLYFKGAANMLFCGREITKAIVARWPITEGGLGSSYKLCFFFFFFSLSFCSLVGKQSSE